MLYFYNKAKAPKEAATKRPAVETMTEEALLSSLDEEPLVLSLPEEEPEEEELSDELLLVASAKPANLTLVSM